MTLFMVLGWQTGVKDAALIVHPVRQLKRLPLLERQVRMTDRASASKPLWFPLYRLVRPIVRPIAWRLRTFLTGRLHDELAELRTQTEALRAELRELSDMQQAAVDRRVVELMEQTLVTMALDRERRP